MHKNNIILIILFWFTFLGCNKQKADVQIINIKKAFGERAKIFLSEIATDIQYIPLENVTGSYIGEVKQIINFDEKFFILDSRMNNIKIFKLDGKYIRTIDKEGNGPGEYIAIGWIDISRIDSKLYLLDYEKNELMIYDTVGNFISKKEVPGSPAAFNLINKKIVFLSVYPEYAYNNNYSITIMDEYYKKIKKYLKNPYLSKEDAFKTHSTGDFLFSRFEDTIFYWEFNKKKIYKIVNDGIENYYTIIFPNNNSFELYNIILSDRFIFLTGDKRNNTPFRMLYDKKEVKGRTLPLKNADELNYGFINDIDGGYTFWPDGALDGKHIFECISLFELKKHMGKKQKSLKKNNPKSINNLGNLIENTTIEDNKCIMIVKLKSKI